MGRHKCCDCPEPLLAETCADLVAGNPPSRCNWWPEAYDVTVEFNGYAVYRDYARRVGSCGGGSQYNCPPTGSPSLLSPGDQWICNELEWTWSLTTRIYRFLPFPLPTDCSDQAICDPDENCGPPNFFSVCDEPSPEVSDGIGYLAACCGDERPIATGTLTRTVKSTTGYSIPQGGSFLCLVSQGTVVDTAAIEKDFHVHATCFTSFEGAFLRLTVAAKTNEGCPTDQPWFAINNARAWFDSQASIINTSNNIAGPGATIDGVQKWHSVPMFGHVTALQTNPNRFNFDSDLLAINLPGQVGEMQSLGIDSDLVGCDAVTLLSEKGDKFVFLGGDSCRPGGSFDYGHWTATATVSPVEGSI